MSGLLGLWIASTLVRPLRRLDEAASRAADGELSVRLPEDGVAELAQVTTTFNNMVARNEAVIRGLEESEEQSRRFVADVSHELRTPLAALVPVSEILREEIPNLPPDAGAAARIVSSEIGKLTRLVEDLIEMSRHDSQQAHLVLDDVDLVELTERTLESRGWSETVELLANESNSARVDSRRIDIVVANLVGNALRHGAPPVRVELSAEPGYAVITVVDHGPGISPDERQAIFCRFYKVDPGARPQRGKRTRTLPRRRERALARRHHRHRPGGWTNGLHRSPARSLTAPLFPATRRGNAGPPDRVDPATSLDSWTCR